MPYFTMSNVYICNQIFLKPYTIKLLLTMPKFIITTKQMKNANGIRIEPGMSVEVVTQSMSNPVLTNGGQPVADAFMRIYGIDIRRAGALNMAYLDVERIN